MPSKVWDVITYPFQNFNGYPVETWELISNFIAYNYNGCNYLSMLGFKLNLVSKRGSAIFTPFVRKLGDKQMKSNHGVKNSEDVKIPVLFLSDDFIC